MTTLPYSPEALPRELKRHYISMTDDEVREILKQLGIQDLRDLYAHIPRSLFHELPPGIDHELEYNDLISHVTSLSKKNHIRTSFIGDGLQDYSVPKIVNDVCNIRGLSTAYTPYQPERSQGTLISQWIYSSCLSALTGFEAINSSLYDRSTAIFEAANTALRIVRGSDTIILFESLFPGDIEVVKTLATGTSMKIITVPFNKKTGLTDLASLKEAASAPGKKLAAIVFPQVNCLGNLEEVDAFSDLCAEIGVQSIAVIDPILLSNKTLKSPVNYGKKGADMIVGEAQHLCLEPNFGGPGLGLFGIRYNENNKNSIRATAGRFVGDARDEQGRVCKTMILSTREQHIRREKAGSNICSNEAFIATLAGAAVLSRGAEGLSALAKKAHENAMAMCSRLSAHKGVSLAYPSTPFFNEFVLELPVSAKDFITQGVAQGIHAGVDVSARTGNPNHVLLSFFDHHSPADLDKLEKLVASIAPTLKIPSVPPSIPARFFRTDDVSIPSFTHEELLAYYKKLGDQNVSPDSNVYPLGSCTMKYNPWVNEYLASLEGFTKIHPQAPVEDCQGSLEILYKTQEYFKAITGLAAVTTQPVAGAQGELTGIKMFQAYHRNRGEERSRTILLVPRSAHGTNPATATMAGFETRIVDGVQYGIVIVDAYENGLMNISQLQEYIEVYGNRIAGIMVTNPNTSGVFETRFKEMADLIHSVGGLVYMDGANMNAIAGHMNLAKMGVDAVHNNLHKTWSIPHGGGGPGDAIVAVSEKLVDFLPGIQVVFEKGLYQMVKAKKSIGSFHRHFGNFAHKIRAYSYLRALGSEGVKRMSAMAVLSARYLFLKASGPYPILPKIDRENPIMHEFILTLSEDSFHRAESVGIPHAQVMAKVGKLFLDFGIHAPTVSFPEVYGLMIEPTESYTKGELDRFAEILRAIDYLVNEHPEVLTTAPHFTPIGKVDEVAANKNPVLSGSLNVLPDILPERLSSDAISKMNVVEVTKAIIEAHRGAQ